MEQFKRPLNKEQEENIINDFLNGTIDESKVAKEKLIEHNMRLVAHIAKRYVQSEDIEDLISIGTIGLIKAIQTFDISKGRLATYAGICINNEILMHMRIKKKQQREISLFEPIGSDGKGNTVCLADILEDEKQSVSDDYEMRSDLKDAINALKYLKDRERYVLIRSFGLDGRGGATQDEIARELGISRSYVSRIKNRSLFKLHDKFIYKEEKQ